MKSLKYFVLSLSVILLFSCASSQQIESDSLEELTQDQNMEYVVDEIVEDDDSEETNPEIDISGYVASDEVVSQKGRKNKVANAHTPMYQRNNKQVKFIEKKKILVKPITDLSNETHEFTTEEIKAFFKDVEENDILDESKDYSSESVKILMENYKNILQTSSMCCVSNIVENFKMHGLKSNEIVGILSEDIDDQSIQERCLIVSKEDIKETFEDGPIADMVTKAREVCICNNKDYLRKNIGNFYRLYNKNPDFYEKYWVYRYKDKQGNIIEDNVNETILNIAITLESCP